jgi:hypothetical protein
MPGAVYQSLAAKGGFVVAAANGGKVCCLDAKSGEVHSQHDFSGKEIQQCLVIPSMIELQIVGEFVFVQLPWAILRLRFPSLTEATWVKQFHPFQSQFERFMDRLGENWIALADRSPRGNPGAVDPSIPGSSRFLGEWEWRLAQGLEGRGPAA